MTAAPGPVIIGLDVGTTAVKAVGFSPGSPWRCSAQRDLTLLSPDPAHRVQDPDSITVALAEALTEVVAACDSGQVIGVSLATAMHGLIGLGSDHRPLTPLITWADGRAGDEAMDLIRSGQADELHRMSGTPVHPMSPLTKLLWFSRHEPETLRRVRWWGGVKEVVLHWLTGEVATELSSASGTGLLDLTTGGWSEPALEVVGVGAHQLPPILATTAKLGLGPAAAARVGLREGTPVIVGAADGPLGNVGTGALDRGVAGLSLGTSAAVRTVVGRPDPHLLRGRPGLFSYAITDDRWVMGGAISNGGSVSRWAVDTLLDGEPGEVDDDDLIELASEAPPGADGLVMLPFLLSERAPLWNPDLSAAFVGLRADHTRAHLARAAIEGVCLQVRALVDRVDAVAPIGSVRATGGVFASGLWRPVLAACLGRPVHVVDGVNGTAAGAAALGLIGLDRATDLEDAIRALGTDPGAPPPPEPVDQQAAEIYTQLRAAVGPLLQALERADPTPGSS